MSCQRYCGIYKATSGKWYLELAPQEYGQIHDAYCYGPFRSEAEADKYLHRNFSNPGGCEIDDSGTRTEPTTGPNGVPVVKPM